MKQIATIAIAIFTCFALAACLPETQSDDDTYLADILLLSKTENNSSRNTDWAAYTPFTQGRGNVTGVEFVWRRVGDSIDISGRMTTGTVTAVEMQVGLPTGQDIDTDITTGAVFIAGEMYRGTVTPDTNAVIATPGDTFFNFAFANAGSGAFVPQNGSVVLGNSELFGFFATAPIAGW